MTDGTGWRRWTGTTGGVLGRLRRPVEGSGPAAVPQPRPAPWMAGGPGDELVERGRLQTRLRELLLAGDVALHGIGGIGKTTLAEQVVRLPGLRDRFPGGLLWATVGQQRTGAALAALVGDLVEQLTGERPGVVTPAQAGVRLAAALAHRPPVLLVIDDVWTAEQLEPFLDGPGCRRLITTRVAGALPEDLPRIEVGGMGHDEATALLTRDLPGLALPDLTALLALTGRWPLLISLVNGVLRHRVAPHQLIDQLGAYGWVALDLAVPGERERAVEGTAEAALELLTESDRRRLLELGIFPGAEPIPDAMTDLLWAGTGELNAGEAAGLRATYARLGLVKPTADGLRVAGVLRAYLRNRLLDPEIAQVNRRLLEMARPRSGGPWWTLPATERHLWRHLAFHLREAGWWDELFATVTDLRRLARQIPMLGVAAAVADLDRVPDPRAGALRARLSRGASLFAPIEPADALADVLLARLSGAPELAAGVTEFAAAQRGRAGLTARWPLPDVGPDSLTRVIGGGPGWLDAVAVATGWIATGGASGVITLHDPASGDVLARLTGHPGAIKALAATYDGASLISAGADGTLRLWDVDRRQERTLWTTSGEILGCAAAPASHRIAAVSAAGELIVLDVAGNWRILGHRGGERLVGCTFYDDDRVLTASDEGAVVGHDLRSGRRKVLVMAGKDLVAGLAAGPSWVALGGVDGTIRIQPIRGGGETVTVRGHQGCVSTIVAFGDRIISGGEDGTIRMIDRYGAQVAVVRAHPGWVTGCVIGPDRRTLMTTGSDGTVRVWDLPRLGQETVGGPVDWVDSCAVAPSGTSLISGGRDGVVRRWEIGGGGGAVLWAGEEPIRRCVVGPCGSWIAAASPSRTILLREPSSSPADGWEVEELPGALGCAAAPDQDLLAWWDDQGAVTVRSVAGGEPLHRTCDSPIRAAAFLPGHRLILAGAGGELAVWQCRKNRLRPLLPSRRAEVRAIHVVRDRITVIDASGVACFDVRTLRRTGCAAFAETAVTHGAVSADGSWLATTSQDGELRIRPLTGDLQPVAAMRVDGALHECAWGGDSLDLFAAGRRGMYAFTFRPPRPAP
ncbi:putative WD repeat-containing protein [Actinoplanes sp. SE50]|uniref:NB-ARC domain-containing protein n=1 Tax=unclassified Actinoplanes TaxID=2626549 RepID=UPI00023ECE2F|nr:MULTISPECIES: NB-ARC domain-containing protein [unclassified Actinoplanes]AEV83229.1 putative WD repeat-containing protein [Actinoplanes sp. SE50/110]ATO81624.1 putative WD repeat-containing protein [Actinoplanes sp. SE50]SLL99032.1 hypothetical protein ACSP50_2260 [Actinoplanes sp. SE50/110]